MRFCENPKQIKKRKITTHGFCPLDLWYVQVLRTTNARNWLQKIIDTGRRKRVKFYFFPLCKQMQILRETRKETNDNNKNEKKNKRAREKKAKKYCAMFTCFVVVACSNMSTSTIQNLSEFKEKKQRNEQKQSREINNEEQRTTTKRERNDKTHMNIGQIDRERAKRKGSRTEYTR